MNVLAKGMTDLMHKTDSPSHKIMMFMVPFRSIRIIATDETLKSFRVEHLVITNKDVHNPRGTWNTLSTHSGPQPGAAWHPATKAAVEAQQLLARKINQRRQKLLVPA